MIIAANKCDRPSAEKNINKIKEKYPQLIVIPCSSDSELALKEADKAGLIAQRRPFSGEIDRHAEVLSAIVLFDLLRPVPRRVETLIFNWVYANWWGKPSRKLRFGARIMSE